ncbi:MAG: 23S rRNA (adenine(2503)-C(2))-methyltransferase RlmN [Flexistipes sinusarabici]|uniref:Probable dual-specificity RNA methyltransferase RlmN n=1 Tax=Flexistipes sinusarabici TaxID=2352 RepID=A0A5D0MG60_FLESI|nr:23S rRNA (adenine(2503)-C(2))-methyltransferase RlmN [Flexistipes sinusarabici]TYB32694.1 MAG: 23S rRNA (adenine(2503)-C(2))-methyltransferase RlmN [Flexistipes sinusarabici]
MRFLDDLSKLDMEYEMTELGEKPFRGRQLYKWMYSKGVFDFQEMTDLSKQLRQKLKQRYSFRKIEVIEKKKSQNDGSTKLLLELDDRNRIEAVILKDGERLTGCVSTQVGCRMGCSFCSTAKIGLIRNLKIGEIVRQIIIMNRILNDQDEKLSNIVFMGMGEPLDNLDNLNEAIRIILDESGLNFSHRKVTVSTCGMADELNKMYKELDSPVNLAVSLNFTDNEMRQKFMPVSKKYPVESLIATLKKLPVQKRKRITIEYVLIKDINDSWKDAKYLAEMLRGLPVKINLIVYNDSDIGFNSAAEKNVFAFQKVLQDKGFSAFIRKSLGSDIEGACGQLYARYNKKI